MNVMLKPILIAILSLPAAAACLHGFPQAKAPPAFSTKNVKADTPASLQGREVRRVRLVVLNMKLFNDKAAKDFLKQKRARPDLRKSTQMSFFPGVDLTVEWARVEKTNQPAGYVWTGKVAGSQGEGTLAVSGNNVTASITRGDGIIYQIRTTPDGRWWVREIDQKEFPRESEPLKPVIK